MYSLAEMGKEDVPGKVGKTGHSAKAGEDEEVELSNML